MGTIGISQANKYSSNQKVISPQRIAPSFGSTLRKDDDRQVAVLTMSLNIFDQQKHTKNTNMAKKDIMKKLNNRSKMTQDSRDKTCNSGSHLAKGSSKRSLLPGTCYVRFRACKLKFFPICQYVITNV